MGARDAYLTGNTSIAFVPLTPGQYAGALVPSTLVLLTLLGRNLSSLPNHQPRPKSTSTTRNRIVFQGRFFSANGSSNGWTPIGREATLVSEAPKGRLIL